MGGAARRSFQLFQAICGGKALHNAVIVTTMWDKVNVLDAEERESQLKNDSQFFKPALDKAATMCRHDKGVESAHRIIGDILRRNTPSPLAIQVELVDEHKPLLKTRAGIQVSEELDKSIAILSKQLAPLEEVEDDDESEAEREDALRQLAFLQGEKKSLVKGERNNRIKGVLLRLFHQNAWY
jgi:hypothetical protein